MEDNKNEKRKLTTKVVYLSIGPILSVIVFIATYTLDPLNFSNNETINVLPAFLFSILILMITQNIETSLEIKKSREYTGETFEAVKKRLHVISLGSPEYAIEYVYSRLPSLKEVKNTSFNIKQYQDRANKRLYKTNTYRTFIRKIAAHVNKNTIWNDVGDELAIMRFREIYNLSTKNDRSEYSYRVLLNNEPQINYILLEYDNGDKEVLFNWDYRGNGQDPIVLLSRDLRIIEMFTIQYYYLWHKASEDHDRIATKSTPKK